MDKSRANPKLNPYVDKFLDIILDDGIFESCERGSIVVVVSVRPSLKFTHVVKNTEYNAEVEFWKIDKERRIKKKREKKKKQDEMEGDKNGDDVMRYMSSQDDHRIKKLKVDQNESKINDLNDGLVYGYYHALSELEEMCEEYNNDYDSNITVPGCVKQITNIKKPKTEDLNLGQLIREIEDKKITYISNTFKSEAIIVEMSKNTELLQAIKQHTAIGKNEGSMHVKTAINRFKMSSIIELDGIHKKLSNISHECSPEDEAKIMGMLPWKMPGPIETIIKSLISKSSKAAQYLLNIIPDLINILSDKINKLHYWLLDLE